MAVEAQQHQITQPIGAVPAAQRDDVMHVPPSDSGSAVGALTTKALPDDPLEDRPVWIGWPSALRLDTKEIGAVAEAVGECS